MKSLGAALVILIGVSGWATGQLAAPTPPPVPTTPQTDDAPQRVPSFRVKISTPTNAPVYEISAPTSAPVYESVPEAPSPIANIRVPTQYGALYNTPHATMGSIYPSDLRRGSATPVAGCASGVTCEPFGRVFGEFDYILWKTRGDGLPALVTTSLVGTAPAQAGVLGAPGTRTIGGASSVDDDFRSGLRYNVGIWLNPGQSFGVQTGGFFLDDTATRSTFASTGDPILARPFINAISKAPNSQLVAVPGIVAGSVAIDHHNSVSGFDAALRGNMCCGACWRLDALLGYRYLHIEDGLAIGENLVAGPLAPGGLGVPTGTSILVVDRFQTTNTFNGLQVGMAGEYRLGAGWFVSGVGKASLGWIDQVANISGDTTMLVPGQALTSNVGGLLALSSNIGRHAQSNAVVIPELNLNMGIQLTQNLRVRAGYNFLYISSVARPGTIVDTTVNPGLLPPPSGALTPARPIIQNDRTDFILHGINAGLELRF